MDLLALDAASRTVAKREYFQMHPDAQLEQLLKILVDRFGTARTLGEVYATTYALRAYREGKHLTLADIAEHTDIPKQNLSRWLKVHVQTDHAVMQPHAEDGRMNDIEVTDLDYACRHLEAIAAALGSEVTPPRERL